MSVFSGGKCMGCWYLIVVLLACHIGISQSIVVLISIDGFRWDYMVNTSSSFAMLPNIARLSREGSIAMNGVTGVSPTVTYPSHTTLITGVNPNQHRIYCNTLFDPQGDRHHWPPPDGHQAEWYWNYTSIRAKTLFRGVKEKGGKTASVFWPVTVDSEEDVDHLVPEIWPAYFVQQHSKGAEMATDILEKIVRENVAFVDDMTRWEIASRFLYLRPDFIAIHFGDVDFQQHNNGAYSGEALVALNRTDEIIGKLLVQLDDMDALEESTIFIASDHGFANVSTNVYPNSVFREAYNDDSSWVVTAWAAGGSAGIYVDPQEEKTVEAKHYLDDLFKDEAVLNEWGIEKVIPAENISALGGWHGAYKVLEFIEGYEVLGEVKSYVTCPSTHKGTHGYPPTYPSMKSALIMWGKNIARKEIFEPVYAVQIAPTIAAILGISLDKYNPSIPAENTPIAVVLAVVVNKTNVLLIAGAFSIAAGFFVVVALRLLSRGLREKSKIINQ